MLRALLSILLLIALQATAMAAPKLADTDLGKYRTPATEGHVPYRAMQTPGRSGDELLPLIVFLHGDWQDGDDNIGQLAGRGNGSFELVDAALAERIPLVYVVPQTTHAYWPPARVAWAIADAERHFPIDPRRIVLTGISDGATGVWDALKTWPRCFAAGVPMSGMTELAGLAAIRDVPQWIFHGAKDNDTNVETGYGGAMVGSRAVVRALRALGGHPRYTEYPDGMHTIWHQAYAERGLLPWILDRRLPHPPCDFAALAAADR